MTAWLQAAADYAAAWVEHQAHRTEGPGFALAILHRGRRAPMPWTGRRAGGTRGVRSTSSLSATGFWRSGPDAFPPFADASEIVLYDPDRGAVAWAPAMERFGEPVRRIRRTDGTVGAIRIGGARHLSEEACSRGLLRRYGPAG